MSDEDYTRRDALKAGATAATGVGLAGCGSNDSPDRSPDTPGDNSPTDDTSQEPQLQDVNLMLESGSEKADFTQNEEYALGLKAELEYSDGSTETKEVTDYEIENAEVRKTSEDGKTGDEEGYGVLNGIGENLDFTEFTEGDLKKAGHYQSLDNIDTQEGNIILDSDDLITGYTQIDLDINVTDQEISDYINNYQDQEIIQVHKPEQQALQDLQVQGPEAIELWQKYREIRAETLLGKMPVPSSNELDNLSEFQQEVERRVRDELEEDENPDLQQELAHWGTEFGILFMEENNGAGPSGGTTELASMLADAELVTSDLNIIPGQILDNGHDSNPVYVPGSNDPSSDGYWNGKTYNVNTQLEDVAHPPDQLRNYTVGPYGQMFKRPEKDPDLAKGTFDSFMQLDEDDTAFDEEYALSLVDELADDTDLWQDNLQHIMETAVANLFSTEHDLIPTGSAGTPEVKLN